MKKSEKSEMRFEDGLAELENIVKRLESGEAGLEESFSEFEKGKALEKRLRAMLDAGDQRIRVLTESGEHALSEEALS